MMAEREKRANPARYDISRHFRNEARWMVGIPLALLLVGLLAALFGPFILSWFAD